MKKKIILINSCKGLYGGVESFLLNIFNSLDPDKYEVTFLTCGVSTYNMFRKEILLHGGTVDEIPIYANSIKKQYKLYNALVKYFDEKKPDIVHINSGGLSFHYVAGRAAKKSKISSIILHSHNFIPDENSVKEVLKSPVKNGIAKYGTRFLACSKGAAYWIFPAKIVNSGKVEIIPNGIDTERFRYDIEKRKIFRKEFSIGDELVIGNIGRFQPQKNHEFIVNLMKEIVKRDSRAKLLLAGDGELKEHIGDIVKKYKLENNIIFLGERKDMDAFLSAIDVFILPSLHEGLPIAAIEAQASGAKVLLADTITEETNVSGNVDFLPIINGKSEVEWADHIFEAFIQSDNEKRVYEKEKVEKAGYDVNVCTTRMNRIYEGE